MNSQDVRLLRESKKENAFIVDALKTAEQILQVREQANLDKNSLQVVVQSFTKLSEDITADSFFSSKSLDEVNKRFYLDVQIVIEKLLLQIPEKFRHKLLDEVVTSLSNKEDEVPFYIR